MQENVRPGIPICVTCGEANHDEFIVDKTRAPQEGFFITLTHVDPDELTANLLDHNKRRHVDDETPARYMVLYKRASEGDPIRFQECFVHEGAIVSGDIHDVPAEVQTQLTDEVPELTPVGDGALAVDMQNPAVSQLNMLFFLLAQQHMLENPHVKQKNRVFPKDRQIYPQPTVPYPPNVPVYPRRDLSGR